MRRRGLAAMRLTTERPHMLTIHAWPKWLKEFLLTHSLYKSPRFSRHNHPHAFAQHHVHG